MVAFALECFSTGDVGPPNEALCTTIRDVLKPAKCPTFMWKTWIFEYGAVGQ